MSLLGARARSGRASSAQGRRKYVPVGSRAASLRRDALLRGPLPTLTEEVAAL